MSEEDQSLEESIPTVSSDDSDNGGDIKISHNVIASIVRLAALEVHGVFAIDSGIVDGITEIFKAKESNPGIRVSENEAGEYCIEIRVEMAYGLELARTAMEVRENIRRQVKQMTMTEVAKVDVLIERVRMPKEGGESDTFDPQA